MRRLLIFLKEPTPGQVKTRLSRSLGEMAASEIYRACIELTLERLRLFRREATLYVSPPQALDEMRSWLGDWLLRPQQGRTLGERLTRATEEVFADGTRQIIVIGTDSPWLTAEDIEEAFRVLHSTDVVIGPAQDGGYYLIGLAKQAPGLFDHISWSTTRVYAETLHNAHALGLRVERLRRGYDIDHVKDLKRFVTEQSRRIS